MAITEFLLSGLRPEDALAFVRHLGSADPDLREADREVLAPVLTVTEGNPFLIKLVIRQYLATRRSLDRVMADLTGLGAGDTGPGLGRRVREHLYVRSLAQLADRCGEEVAASLMGAFCVKDRGTSFGYEELMTISGMDDPALFEQALEFACRSHSSGPATSIVRTRFTACCTSSRAEADDGRDSRPWSAWPAYPVFIRRCVNPSSEASSMR